MIGGICPWGPVTSPGVGFHWSRDFPSPRFSSPFSTGLDIFVCIIRQICFQLFLRVYAFHPFYCYLDWCFMGYVFDWRPPHLERCQHLLLSPLRILSVPSAGVTKYGPTLSRWKQDLLLGFLLRTLLPHHFICCEEFISWCYSDIQWNVGLLENIWRLWRSLKKLLCGFRTIIVMQPSAEVISSQRLLWPPSLVTQSLLWHHVVFIFIRAHIITWSLLPHLFALIARVRILSVLFNGTSLVLIIAWDIFTPQ